MKSIPIKEKLILYFVFIGVVAIIAVGSYSFHFAKKAILDRTFDQLISLRLEKKNRVEQFFLDRVLDIYIISESDNIKTILENLKAGKSPGEETGKFKIDSPLNQIINANGYYSRLYVTSPDDKVFYVNSLQMDSKKDTVIREIPNESISAFCKNLEQSGSTIIRDLTKSDPFIYIGTPVFNELRKLNGYIILEIPINALNKIMFDHFENNGLGKTGETYLVSNDFLMRSNSRFKGNAVLNIKVASQSVINAINGETGVGIVKDYRDITCLSSYSRLNINGLNWVIIAEIDEMEAMTPVYAIRNSILLISIVIAATVFILALMLAIEITAPLKKLQKASEQIGAGNYNINLPVSSQDELGALTGTFNNMVNRLKKQSEEIEEEKTKRISTLLDGQEMERQRLARDLHDSLGQSILTANMKLEQAKNADLTKIQLLINETQDLLRQIIQEVKNISNDLMPSTLSTFGIDQGLNNFCKETSKNSGILVAYSSENIPDYLSSNLEIYLFRITQEAINNIIKHSAATKADIRMSCSQNTIFLSVADNGSGFDIQRIDSNGNGIMNIRERVKSFKGQCSIQSDPENGTLIEIAIPIT
jgi:signal transduction histidine kinase